MKPLSHLSHGLLGLLLLLPCGCGSGSALNPVKGKVTFKNEPLKGAVVTFHPKGATDVKTIRPVGLTDEKGEFTLTSGQKEGAMAGEYVVTIICSEEVTPKGGKKVISTGPPETRDRLQGAYAEHTKSTLNVEVKPGPNQLEPFVLK
jgi:hypothetical protein